MTTLTLIAVALLAYSNGADDNFKGVATLFGIGLVSGTARRKTILTILTAWVTTLPLAALLAALAYWLVRRV